VQGQQLLPKGEVLQEEFFSGTKGGDNPSEQMSKAHKHLGMIAKTAPGRCTSNSLILRTAKILARHNNDRFVSILDEHLPRWRSFRDLLNAAPLAHETWDY
jgi:hypothetical protein